MQSAQNFYKDLNLLLKKCISGHSVKILRSGRKNPTMRNRGKKRSLEKLLRLYDAKNRGKGKKMLFQMTFKNMKSSRKLQELASERLQEICSKYLKSDVQASLHCELYGSQVYLNCRIKTGEGFVLIASSKGQLSFEAAIEQLGGRLRQQLAKRKWKRNMRLQDRVPAKKKHLEYIRSSEHWSESEPIDAEAILQYEGLFGGLRKTG